MKKFIFITFLIVCLLVIDTVSQNCSFAHKAYESCQNSDLARSVYLDEIRPPEYELYITEGQPGYELLTESDVATPFWDEFRRARILLNAAEIINHAMFLEKECNDLSSYTNCFTPHSAICYNTTGLCCNPNAQYRTLGGTCNNLQSPRLAAQYSAYSSRLPPDYDDCIHSERRTFTDNIELPSPRRIGNILVENNIQFQPPPPQSQTILNRFGYWFGQLITHDSGSRINVQRNDVSGPGIQCCSQNNNRRLSEEISHPGCQPMDIPRNDPFYSQYNAGCLNFIRSQTTFASDCKVGPARQSNTVSSFLDLTIIYGDDLPTLNSLRTGKSGLLKTSPGNVLPVTPNCTQDPCYFLGDARLVQTPMLALWHSLVLRLHNIIAPQINASNDELAFQLSKRLTTALYQRLIYNEWLPIILGQAECTNHRLPCDPSRVNCGKYNPNLDPSNTNEHTHGAYRWFHSIAPSIINFYGRDFELIKSRTLSDMNSSQVHILEHEYNSLLRGLMIDPVNFGGYTPELRNKFMKNARGMGIDLFAIDVQRGRDHGIRAFHDYVSLCTKTRTQINTWSDLERYFTVSSLKILQKMYNHPRDIDLYVGVIAEKRAGPLLGKIGSCIIAEQFQRFKFGDRFFYQWADGPYPFTEAQLQEIEQFSAAKFVCTVTNVGSVPQSAFLTPNPRTNPMMNCDSIPKFKFDLFKI